MLLRRLRLRGGLFSLQAKVLIVVALALSGVALVATPAHAAANCTSAKDASCPGAFCYGYNSQTGWQTCVGSGPGPCDTMVCRNPCDLFVDGCDPCRTMECYPPEALP